MFGRNNLIYWFATLLCGIREYLKRIAERSARPTPIQEMM
jgi:hypothetical protein